jgi:methyl-accepting chemotaxis protein
MTALTIGRKSAAMVTALVAIGLVVVILWQVQQQKSLLTESVSKNYRIVVELLAGQLSGAFRWNKPEAIEKAFESLQLVDAEALTAIYAKDVQGSALFSATIPGFDATTTGYGEFVARLQAPEAISLHQLNDLLLVSTPIFSGKENAYVGSLTLTWNLAALNQQIHDAAGLQFGIGLAVLLIVAVAVIFLLQKLVGSPIAEASRIAGEIARGNLNNTFSFASRDEVGLLGASLHQMQQELVGRLERDARSAAEMLRLKEALDNASSSIVVTSSDHRIIFVNQAAPAVV